MKTFLPKSKFIVFFSIFIFGNFISSFAQTTNIVLGRPTDTSITASVMFNQDCDYYYEYGTQTGSYPSKTSNFSAKANVPDERDMQNLTGNTKYFYRLRYKSTGSSTYLASPEYHFNTQRKSGETFTFTIEADEHLYDKKGVKNMYQRVLNNQAQDNPDFMISMGDIFGDDHNPFTITASQLDVLHKNYRPFLGTLCHSIPFYVCLGNHEGEMDYYMVKNPGTNLAVWGTLARKLYYPNPYPNSFYSGNTDQEPYGVGNPENYYSWNWGDALFVVLDVYRDQCDTSAKPGSWAWTLGAPQYNWLKNTLEGSKAKYKFVFAHHVRGQGRGGISNAKYFEWGGYEADGTTYGFTNKRSGWSKPIHKLFVDNGVNIFFQGHDHVFAHEALDGVTYQALPMAADSTYQIGALANADAYLSDTMNGTGHMRVTVSPDCIKVDYVKAFLPKDTNGIHKNGEIGFSYALGSCPASSFKSLKAEDLVTVYPNPANSELHLLFKQKVNDYTVDVYNSLGQLVLTSNSDIINTSMISDGIYSLKIHSKEFSVSQKLMVNH